MARRAPLTILMKGTLTAAWLMAAAFAPQAAHGQTSHASRGHASAAVADPVPLMSLERTACHGQCAEYKLSFYDDGQVLYDGKANVSKAGHWHATVSKQIVSQLLGEFQRMNFQSLQDRYPAGLTETSTAVTSLRTGDKIKAVTHDVGSPFPPAALIALEDRIDAAVQSVNWIRG